MRVHSMVHSHICGPSGPVAIVASQPSCVPVKANTQHPKLHLLGGNFWLLMLRESDFVQKPVSAARVRHILWSFRKKHIWRECVPKPSFASRELAKVCLAR